MTEKKTGNISDRLRSRKSLIHLESLRFAVASCTYIGLLNSLQKKKNMDFRDKIIADIAEGWCRKISGKVVRNLRKMTEELQSGYGNSGDTLLNFLFRSRFLRFKFSA